MPKIGKGIIYKLKIGNTMTTMNISLPESLKEYVKERAAQTDYSNPSDYVRALIRQDKKNQAQEHLEELLLDGLNSGNLQEMTAADWKEIRQKVHKRINDKVSV
jgi:antitoxin ParD1/3/4